MRISKLVSALAAATLLIATATARADVAPLPTGGQSSTGGSSAAGGGSSSITAGASSTSAPNEDDGGCSIGKSHRASGIALGVLGVALAFGLSRVRSRN